MSNVTTSRGAETRSAIIDAALALFEERGFDATTMRAIAQRAGVSVGNAYYYFASKDQLVQGFYDRAAAEHLQLSVARLDGVDRLADRIYRHLIAWFDLFAPYHHFATQFFRVAADPDSPLSPLSQESEPARRAAIDQWRIVVNGATDQLDDEVRAALPDLLWLLHMGILVFWVYDRSPDQTATRLTIGAVTPLVVRIAHLADVPELHGVMEDAIALFKLAPRQP